MKTRTIPVTIDIVVGLVAFAVLGMGQRGQEAPRNREDPTGGNGTTVPYHLLG